MKTMIGGLLVALGLTTSIAGADFLNEEDDTYIGFQLTTRLDSASRRFPLHRSEYSYLLIGQKNGIKSGVTFTRNGDGHRVINYVAASPAFGIGESSISEYAIPVINLDGQPGSTSNNHTANAVGGLVALAAISLWIKHEVEKPWKPASPD